MLSILSGSISTAIFTLQDPMLICCLQSFPYIFPEDMVILVLDSEGTRVQDGIKIVGLLYFLLNI